MDIRKEENQRKEFKSILLELAKDQTMLEDAHKRSEMYERLEALYYNESKELRFRHYYSDIFTVLTIVKQDALKGDINILGQNLGVLRKGYQVKNQDSNRNDIDISNEIKKLYDHVSLDIARMLYSDSGDWKISGEPAIKKMQSEVKCLESHVNSATEKMNNAAKEYIAILGIFASIVISFVAGISFSTSILGAINSASVYRISLLACIIGLVFTNVLYWLFYYIDRIINGPKEHNIKFLIITNATFLILIALIIGAWYFGVVENRNIRLGAGLI